MQQQKLENPTDYIGTLTFDYDINVSMYRPFHNENISLWLYGL